MGAVASALGGHGLGAVGRCFVLRPGNNVLGCGFAVFSKGTASKCVILPSNRHEASGYSVPVGRLPGCSAGAGWAGAGISSACCILQTGAGISGACCTLQRW